MNSTLNSTIFDANITTTEASSSFSEIEPGVYTEVKELIWKIVPPIVIILGTFGNGLTILVLLRQINNLSSTAVYLLSLAFSDLLILYLGPIRQWIQYIWNFDVRLLTDAGCKIALFLTYFSLQFSSWLLVAVTAERVISVMLPHKVKLGCTTMKAGITVLIIFVCIFALNSHFFYGYGRIEFPKHPRAPVQCIPLNENYIKFRDDILPWIDFLVAFAIPFTLLTVGNILIIVTLRKNAIRRRKMSLAQSEKEGRSITLMLITLCVIFFICLTPVSIFFIILPYLREDAMKLPYPKMVRRMEYLIFLHGVVSCLSYINASTNFILYFLSGSRFRTEVRRLFTCKRPGKEGVFGSSSAGRSTSLTNTSSGRTRGVKQNTALSERKGENGIIRNTDNIQLQNETFEGNEKIIPKEDENKEQFTDLLKVDGETK